MDKPVAIKLGRSVAAHLTITEDQLADIHAFWTWFTDSESEVVDPAPVCAGRHLLKDILDALSQEFGKESKVCE